MSLIIKGMDMPYCCVVCPFKEMYNDGLLCKATNPHQYIPKFLHKRDEKCPLTEFPTPHGRLIDADKAATSISMMNNHPCGNSIETVNDVVEWLRFADENGNNIAFPTIIEAEGVNE